MNKSISRIIGIILFALVIDASAWIDREGNPLPDEPDRKSIGSFGAWLVLTDKEGQAFANWATPSESVYIDTTDEIERGKILTAIVTFGGCGADKNGNCNLLVKYKIIQPDGAVYSDLPYQEAWVDKPAPKNRSLGMSIGYIRVDIEDDESLGKYTVQAKVVDRNLNKILELETHFLAVEASSQHNKAPQQTQ
jgi:hypothetical protein